MRQKLQMKHFVVQKTINIWNVNVDNKLIPKLVNKKPNSKYLIGYLDKVIRPLVLILPKMNRYIETFKVEYWDKDKSNKLLSSLIDKEKLLKNV